MKKLLTAQTPAKSPARPSIRANETTRNTNADLSASTKSNLSLSKIQTPTTTARDRMKAYYNATAKAKEQEYRVRKSAVMGACGGQTYAASHSKKIGDYLLKKMEDPGTNNRSTKSSSRVDTMNSTRLQVKRK